MRSQTLAMCVGWGLALALACLPFELYAGMPLAGLTFTNVEVLLLAVLTLWGASLIVERRMPQLPGSLVLPAIVLLAILLASAAAAPAWRISALKFSARQIQAALLACCLADQIAIWGWPIARRLGLALIAGAAISAALGLLEIAEAPPVLALLAIFKDQPTMAGGLLRLSATFAYANIAAMYYEAALPICLAAVALAPRGPARRMLSAAALLLCGATLLTYSRAALLTAVAAITIVLLGAIWLQPRSLVSPPRRQGAKMGKKTIISLVSWCLGGYLKGMGSRVPPSAVSHSARHVVGLCGALLGLVIGVLLLSPTFRVRIAAPDVADWYRADYSAAGLPGLAPNELIAVPVTIRNSGLVTWRSAGLRPIALSYHWLDPLTRRVVRYNGRRTLLPRPVEPGGALSLSAEVQAPDKPGDYLLAWDMVVEHSGWFSERGNPMAEIAVTVAGRPAVSRPAPGAEPATMPRQIVVRPAPPPRSQLWGAAVRMWSARPLLGIGPDVFRHTYGPQLGLRIWDDRLHTNSLYLELLVGAGVAGLAAFLLLIGLALWGAVGALVLQRKAGFESRSHSTLSRPQAVLKGAASCEPRPSIRASAPLRRRFSTTQGAMPGSLLCAVILACIGGKAVSRTPDPSTTLRAGDGRRTLPLSSIVHRPSSAGSAWIALGCGVALLAFLIHGVLDMFLEYSATSMLLWGLIGVLGNLTAAE